MNTRLSEAKKQIEQLKEELEKMKMLYGIIDDAYKALPKNEKEWVDNNWKSMIYKWADDLEESAFSSCQDMSSDEEDEEAEFEDCEDCGFTHPTEDKCPQGSRCCMYEKWRKDEEDE